MAEFLRPDADVSIGGWTKQDSGTSNLFESINESSLDDADYIISSPDPVADVYRFRISDPTSLLEDGTLRYRYEKTGSGTVNLTARLIQGNSTTWNPADKSASLTLTDRDRTITTTGASIGGIRSVLSFSSGKKYCELTVTSAEDVGDLYFGIATAAWSLTSALGFTGTTSIGRLYVSGGNANVWLNSGDVGDAASHVEGDVIGMAVDFDNERIWFRTNGGNWNNSGTADPATNTEGIDFSSLSAGPYFIALVKWNNASVADVFTLNSVHAFTPPAGFVNWGGSDATIVEWEHTDIAASFVTAEQTLTTPQFEAITDLYDLFGELEANLWSEIMALYDVVGGLWLPAAYAGNPPIISAATFVIDATGETAVLVFRAPKAGDIDRFDFQVTVSNSPDNGLRASFQTVDATTGYPTGTILGATNNAFVTYAHTVTTGWKSTNFGEVVTVTRGQLLAAVVDIPTFTASDSVTVWRIGVGVSGSLIFPYGISGVPTKEGSYLPNMAIHYTDGYVVIAPQYYSGASATAQMTYNSGTAVADEWGMAFSVPGACKFNAVQIQMQTAAGSDFDVVVYDTDGTTELSVVSFDGDETRIGADGQLTAYLQSELTLTKDATYRVTVRPTTTTNVLLRYCTFQSLALMDTVEGGSSLYMCSKVDDGGTWTDYNSGTFRRPVMSILLSAISGAA